jgi:hypothetical protein
MLILLAGCGSSPEWVFQEPPSAHVQTQYIVIEKKKPILFALHDRDGEWQFLADDHGIMDPVIEVSFNTIVAIDSTVAQLASLEPGWKAVRTAKSAPWHIEKYTLGTIP